MARVHVCADPACSELAAPGRSRCATHDGPRKAWKHRDGDRAKHAHDVREAKRRHRSCQVCGSTEKLDVHHDQAGNPVVLCNEHHVQLDPHARRR